MSIKSGGARSVCLPRVLYPFPQAWLIHVSSLKKAQADSAALTPEYVAANMAPEEQHRLSRVRNIGIAVGNSTAFGLHLHQANP